MRKILSIVTSLILTMSFCNVVIAGDENSLSVAGLLNDERVEQLYYDESGSVVVVFKGDPILTMEEGNDASLSDFNTDKRIEQRYYDENGNLVVVFREDLPTTMRKLEEVQCSEAFQYVNPSTSDKEITCTSSLGPVTTEELWAQDSVQGTSIEKMWVQCMGYYESGAYIDTARAFSDPRYTYLDLTVKVKVPETPFGSARVGKGISDHSYEDSRFITVRHHLTWNVE